MSVTLGQEKPSLDALSHHGIKGMKWGHHKPQAAGGSDSSGPSNRQLNKVSRANDKTQRKQETAAANKQFDSEIDAARAATANSKQRLSDAKAQREVEKKTLGTRQARKNFHAVKDDVALDRQVAQFAKSGKETRNAVLASVGVVTLATIARHLAA